MGKLTGINDTSDFAWEYEIKQHRLDAGELPTEELDRLAEQIAEARAKMPHVPCEPSTQSPRLDSAGKLIWRRVRHLSRLVAVNVTETMWDDLSEFAAIDHRTVSSVVREALRDYLYGKHSDQHVED